MAIFKGIILSNEKFENYKEKCHDLLNELVNKLGKEVQPIFNDLIEKNYLPTYFIHEKADSNIALMLFHLQLVLTHSKHELLKPFSRLLKKPSEFFNSYLPSMPHDDDFEIFSNFRNINKENLKWFKCGNGHLYTIGDCTKPATTSVCPTCGGKIGGTAYVLVEGNKVVDNLIEKIQTGYCIQQDSLLRQNQLESIRNMGFLNTTLIRLLLDSTLYLSSIKNDLTQLVKFKVENVTTFFAQQILKDIQMFSNYIQHSPEESALLVHYLLNQLSKININKNLNNQLQSKKQRDEYEILLCNELITKIIGNDYDKLIKQMTTLIADDLRDSSSDQLSRISYDLIQPDQNSESFLNDKKYWSFRKQINVESMINNFNSLNNKKEFKLLNEFIQNMNELEALNYLPRIAKMVVELHNKFNRQIDRQYASSMKISDLDNRLPADLIQNGCQSLLSAWQILKFNINNKLGSNKVTKLDLDNLVLNENDYTQIPLSYLLPSTFKDGQFVYSILFYLINLQNDFIKFINNDSSKHIETIDDLTLLNSTNCISFSVKKDLLQVVYMNSNYSLGLGQDIEIEFNYSKIESTLLKRYLEDKHSVDPNCIPLIEYSDDITDLSRFEALNRKVPQVRYFIIISSVKYIFKMFNLNLSLSCLM